MELKEKIELLKKLKQQQKDVSNIYDEKCEYVDSAMAMYAYYAYATAINILEDDAFAQLITKVVDSSLKGEYHA